jgi:recombination protein RecR
MICVDPKRDKSTLCVIAETHDITNLEKTGLFKGYYHVLNGVIDPIHGQTPDKLTLDSLLAKIQQQPTIKEVILALNPDLEGEVTMSYIKKLISPLKIKISRLAQGLPTGADLEYADPTTLSKALSNRTEA